MYRPAAFDVPDSREALALAADTSFGHLVSVHDGVAEASGLPFLVDAGAGVLRTHFARANPHWRLLEAPANVDVLVVFGISDAYVSPSVYPSKAEHGRVVPTWNYEAVHVRGRATILHDIGWLRALVTDLTDHHERRRSTRRPAREPWAVTDGPADFVERQLRAIVGVEVVVESVEAKRKLSQNRPTDDRAAVRDDLAASTDPGDQQVAGAMRAVDDPGR